MPNQTIWVMAMFPNNQGDEMRWDDLVMVGFSL